MWGRSRLHAPNSSIFTFFSLWCWPFFILSLTFRCALRSFSLVFLLVCSTCCCCCLCCARLMLRVCAPSVCMCEALAHVHLFSFLSFFFCTSHPVSPSTTKNKEMTRSIALLCDLEREYAKATTERGLITCPTREAVCARSTSLSLTHSFPCVLCNAVGKERRHMNGGTTA